MNLFKQKEKVEDYFIRLKEEGYNPKLSYHDIDIEQITGFLKKIDRYSDDMRDVIYCLLNVELPNLYSRISETHSISAAASVAHIGSYIGILMRGKSKLDREGRDQWIKPLVDIGIIEPITVVGTTFELGHLTAKSPNSAYRLNLEFIELLKNFNSENFDFLVKEWFASNEKRTRLIVTYEKNDMGTKKLSHKGLIEDSIEIYAKNYLPGYKPVFKDAEDGARITKEEQISLDKYRIKFGGLDDVWPDSILYNEEENSLWFIEAVTSDGEIDNHKLQGFLRICNNSSKKFGGCTTTYYTWKRFYERQSSNNNLAVGTYFWIKECPEKYFTVN
ncbi:BsuBI/PstI family type II restriction endonuclease [Priestia aryabhattai]|uniref:BsuBI/PstI family type II restriction endonuclease n=1 Tax=Priestia aryabhattai TaxID=412384 RepID=UPI002E24A8E7|nr:BsuBI/PstI family type II restriction endonuclease [Priestia aryabhattai]MED3957666.1 BsuBI/PstI family type II restriction endonuclease [Priestia aryabhattai]